MVMLVPDDSDEVTGDGLGTDDSGQPKAQLDDSEASKATQKVDLDLDDAPFLEDEDEEEEVALEEEETPLIGEEEDEESKFNLKALLTNKMVLIFIGIILILLAVIIFLVARDPEPQPEPEPEAVEQIIQEEQEPEVVEIPETLIRLDPFLIEQRDKNDKIRFLEVRIVVTTTDEGLARQFKQETYTVRNALYYYLKNKDLQFLSDENNSEKLKKELLAIINQYMGFGQFETLLFEQYLVR
jgi:flagellar FliL protein